MGGPTWQQWCQRLAAAPRPLPRRCELWQWLEHQKGLHALGWLPPARRRALEAAQVRNALTCRGGAAKRNAGTWAGLGVAA